MKAAWVVNSVAVALASGCGRGDWIDRTLVTETVAGAWKGAMTTATGAASVRDEARFDVE